jgi:alpha-beta hydrolase superfamily lysophospholipase
MPSSEPTVTHLELRASLPDGSAAAGLSHTSEGLVLLHVQELAADGEPRGAVTIVHDAGEHGGRHMELARALAAEGWAVALPDLRGHGKSEGERGHSNGELEVLRDLGDVQDHLAYRQPEAPKVLVGHGLGALWCLAYAAERGGVAALVLAAPPLAPRFEAPSAGGGLRALFKKPGPTTPGRTGWRAEELAADPDARRARAADPLVHDVVTLRAQKAAAAAAERTRARIAALEVPALVLCGGSDPLAPSSDWRPLATPRVAVESVEGAHDLFHDRGAADARARVVRWIGAAVPRL